MKLYFVLNQISIIQQSKFDSRICISKIWFEIVILLHKTRNAFRFILYTNIVFNKFAKCCLK